MRSASDCVALRSLAQFWVLWCLNLFQFYSHACMSVWSCTDTVLVNFWPKVNQKCRRTLLLSKSFVNCQSSLHIPDEQVGLHHTRAPTCISSSSCAPCPPSWPPPLSCCRPARAPSYLQHAQTKRRQQQKRGRQSKHSLAASLRRPR